MPPSTAPVPSLTVESNSAFTAEPARPNSQLSLGLHVISTSTPEECALGTLNTTRDEHEPASSVTCRSFIWVWNKAALKRSPACATFTPTS
jgi:hypothetical protein